MGDFTTRDWIRMEKRGRAYNNQLSDLGRPSSSSQRHLSRNLSQLLCPSAEPSCRVLDRQICLILVSLSLGLLILSLFKESYFDLVDCSISFISAITYFYSFCFFEINVLFFF